jgi:hypothetical protein
VLLRDRGPHGTIDLRLAAFKAQERSLLCYTLSARAHPIEPSAGPKSLQTLEIGLSANDTATEDMVAHQLDKISLSMNLLAGVAKLLGMEATSFRCSKGTFISSSTYEELR